MIKNLLKNKNLRITWFLPVHFAYNHFSCTYKLIYNYSLVVDPVSNMISPSLVDTYINIFQNCRYIYLPKI